MASLALHSPGLFASLRRKFPADMIQLQEAYAVAAAHGGLDELGVQREPGASFNPRPARIASLLLKECEDSSALDIQAAFLASLPNDQLRVLADCPEEILSIAMAAQAARSSGKFHLTSAKKIALALEIDYLRHIHMSPTQPSEQLLAAKQALSFFSTLSNEPQLTRMHQILSDAIRRIEARCS